ncbi:MAG: DUF5671 domain-containing protein [Pseudomonadota bacterium]
MSQKNELARFVRDALMAGRQRDEIEAALEQTGWSDAEVAEALSAYSDIDFHPPVPRPQNIVSARDFFVYALTFLALGTASIYLVLLTHHLIDELWDVSQGRYYNKRFMRSAIAAVMVAGPIYAWLTWRERKRLAKDPGLYRSAIRKWATYIALLVAASVFGINTIFALSSFLNGELTVVFSLKLLAIAIVSGAIFGFYLRDVDAQP